MGGPKLVVEMLKDPLALEGKPLPGGTARSVKIDLRTAESVRALGPRFL